MADTINDLPRIKLWLAQAELALHQLMTGAKTASASYEGKSASFTEADRDRLAVYIGDLKARVGALEGIRIPRRAPIHMTF